MTSRGKDPLDDEFDAFLAGEGELARRLSALPQPESPQRLNDAILAAAEARMAQEQVTRGAAANDVGPVGGPVGGPILAPVLRPSFTMRWRVPVAMAASVVGAVLLMLEWQRGGYALPDRAEMREQAKVAAAPEAAQGRVPAGASASTTLTSASASEPASASASTSEPALASASEPASASASTSEPALASASVSAPALAHAPDPAREPATLPSEKPAAHARAKPAAMAMAKAADMVSLPSHTPAEQLPAPLVTKERAESLAYAPPLLAPTPAVPAQDRMTFARATSAPMIASPAPAPAPAAPAPTTARAAPALTQPPPPPTQPSLPAMAPPPPPAPPAPITIIGSAARAAAAPALDPKAAAWLNVIDEMLKADLRKDAQEEWKKFRLAYPDYPVPEALAKRIATND